MKASDRVYFARNETGKVVDVQHVRRGLACVCVCLVCGGPLLAKQGPQVAWHFAHAKQADQHSCGETVLHLAAKAALQELAAIQLPGATWHLPRLRDSLGRDLSVQVHGPKREAAVAGAELEVHRACATGDVRLDGLLSTSLGGIGIEVLVTHAVDDYKRAKLAMLELPVMELDLSGYVHRATSLEELKSVLQHDAPRRLIAGAEVLFADQVLDAKRSSHERLVAIEAALDSLTAMTPQERQREVELAKHAGVDLANPPTSLGCLKWLALSEPEGIPRRQFSGHHHRLWQLALMVWLQGQRFGTKLSFSSALHGVYKTLGISGIGGDDAGSAEALRAWLADFDWPGYKLKYLYNDDHGWGEDWYRWGRDPSKRALHTAAAASIDGRGQMELW